MKKIFLLLVVASILLFSNVSFAETFESNYETNLEKYDKLHSGEIVALETDTALYSSDLITQVESIKNEDNSYKYVVTGVKFMGFNNIEYLEEKNIDFGVKLPNISFGTEEIYLMVSFYSLDGGYISDLGWTSLDNITLRKDEKTANLSNVANYMYQGDIEIAIMVDVSSSMVQGYNINKIVNIMNTYDNVRLFVFAEDYLEISDYNDIAKYHIDENILGGSTDIFGNLNEIIKYYNPARLIVVSDFEDTYNKNIDISDSRLESMNLYMFYPKTNLSIDKLANIVGEENAHIIEY